MKLFRRAIASGLHASIALFILTLPCNADERILNFHSEISVHRDSTMTVTETIRARSEGRQIKRGIYRDFPTVYRDRYGNTHRVGFHITRVLRDGRGEAYHTAPLENGVRLYIGKKEFFLKNGEYTYTITYTTDRQLGFFEEHDELYWNVTGNGWIFPIDRASARISLPEGFQRDRLITDAYTGPQGSRAKNFTSSVEPTGEVNFRTTFPLRSREGLTIVLGWPKGLIQQPTRRQEAGYFIRDNLASIVGLFGLLVILSYYLATWAIAGRDPAKGTIIPLYTPPEGISPAAMRFIHGMGYDARVFAAAMINIAVKGYIRIQQDDSTYTISVIKRTGPALAPEEKKIFSTMFSYLESVELKSENHDIVSRAINTLKNTLRRGYEKVYFITNSKYLAPGIILSALFILAAALCEGRPDAKFITIFMSGWLTAWTFGVVFLISRAASSWRAARSLGGASAWGRAIFLSIISVPFLGGEIAGLWLLARFGSPLTVTILASIVALNCLFYHLLKAPTLLGRGILDQIEGFKIFLSVAEKERLRFLAPADRTPELFEKYLPYALALGVEQEWSEQFSDVLARAAEGGTAYTPAWYSGSAWSPLRTADFSSSLGNSLSGAISSSSHAPGSSSGFGGGGGSGGGGGGGGGGGW